MKDKLKIKNLKKEYKEVWNYLKSSKYYLLFTVCLFFVVAMLVFFGVQSQEVNQNVEKQLEQIIERFKGLGTFETIFLIFFNNVLASFLGIVLGIFFGIITLGFVISNAYVIGYVAEKSVDSAGLSILWSLVPHGIFELPAVFISFALGIKLGMFVFTKNPWEELRKGFNSSMKVFAYIVFPLLVVAAIIEGILIGIIS